MFSNFLSCALEQKKKYPYDPIVSGHVCIYSFRRLTSFQPYCIRVRRSSDNAVQDIGWYQNVLDEVALLDFVGANDGFVYTWYDQSGYSNHAQQTTNTKQPQIVSGGVVIKTNGFPALTFKLDGSDYFVIVTGGRNIRSMFIVCNPITHTPTTQFTFLIGGLNYHFHGSDTYYFHTAYCSGYVKDGVLRRNKYQITISYTNPVYNVSSMKSNETQVLSIIATNTISGNSQISLDRTFNRSYNGDGVLQEMILFDTDKSSDREAIEEDMGVYYNIYQTINNIVYKYGLTRIIYAVRAGTGALSILSSVIQIDSGAFHRCNSYTELNLPEDYDTVIFNQFTFADFSGESLNQSILNLLDGEVGNPRSFWINPKSLENLLAYNSDAVSDAASRYILIQSYLLDIYTDAQAAYSLRLLKSTYLGYCIKVRRSSDDTTQDIGFANGKLDTASLLSFVGANSGFVHTWYDQSGNSRNLVQATTSLQPRIVNAGTLDTEHGCPALYLSSKYMAYTGNFTTNSSHFAGRNDSASFSTAFMGNPLPGNDSRHLRCNNRVYISGSLWSNIYVNKNTNWVNRINDGHVVFCKHAAGSVGFTGIILGTSYTSRYWVGYMKELILWSSDRTTDYAEITDNMNNSINGYYEYTPILPPIA